MLNAKLSLTAAACHYIIFALLPSREILLGNQIPDERFN